MKNLIKYTLFILLASMASFSWAAEVLVPATATVKITGKVVDANCKISDTIQEVALESIPKSTITANDTPYSLKPFVIDITNCGDASKEISLSSFADTAPSAGGKDLVNKATTGAAAGVGVRILFATSADGATSAPSDGDYAPVDFSTTATLTSFAKTDDTNHVMDKLYFKAGYVAADTTAVTAGAVEAGFTVYIDYN